MRPAREPLPATAPPAWLRSLGGADGRGVRVGLVDSGLDAAWRDAAFAPGIGLLARRPGRRLRFTADRDDLIGHGTACAGILRRMAPAAEIHPIRVFLDRLETSVEVLVAALGWAVEQRLDVVNLSLGSRRPDALEPLYRACEAARRHGVVVVAAVEAASGSSYPAVFDNAIGVAAGRFASIWDYRYRAAAAVECVAQGRRRVRVLGGGRLEATATSYAAPHVSAIVALLRQRHPQAGLERVRELLARYALGGAGRREAIAPCLAPPAPAAAGERADPPKEPPP